MAYVLKEILADRSNYGGKRSLEEIDEIAIHATMNDGDNAVNNGKYYSRPLERKASAHYFIDDDTVVRSVPDDNVAWSVGGAKYNNDGGRLYGIATNKNTLSIEICDELRNGVVYPTAATLKNAIAFTKSKMVERRIDRAHVIRHYDVNGKPCPKYWVDDAKWEREFNSKLVGWAKYNDKWYWLDNDGNIVKNKWIQDKGKWYRLGANGIMFENTWIKNDSGTWSYVGPDGDALTGWQKLAWNGVVSWYYFDEDGNMLSSKWIKSDGKDYYMTKSGALAVSCYVKSTTQNLYYWVNEHGVWEPQWNTSTPNLSKYRLEE